jgi:hypothetical protein
VRCDLLFAVAKSPVLPEQKGEGVKNRAGRGIRFPMALERPKIWRPVPSLQLCDASLDASGTLILYGGLVSGSPGRITSRSGTCMD